jgi:hypothetical protein
MAVATQVAAPPREVRLAAWGWLAAVGSGGVETVLAVTDALSTGSLSHGAIAANVALRAVVYGGVLAITAQLWKGRSWARVALAILLGGIGTLTLITGPLQWVAGWQAGDEYWSDVDADAMFVAFAVVRTFHVVAVWSAMVLMFQPAANAYFRRGRQNRPWR